MNSQIKQSNVNVIEILNEDDDFENIDSSSIKRKFEEPILLDSGDDVDDDDPKPEKIELVGTYRDGKKAKKSKSSSAFKKFFLKHKFGASNDDPEGLLKPVYNPELNKDAKEYLILGVPVTFPFSAYPSQMQVMSGIISALKKRENALLESPTGTGKTLALLCAALSWQEWDLQQRKLDKDAKKIEDSSAPKLSEKEQQVQKMMQLMHEYSYSDSKNDKNPIEPQLSRTKIYICSRTQKQVNQIVNEMRGKTSFRPRMTVLGSRNQYCINKSLDKSTSKNEDCQSLLRESSCSYYGHSETVATLSRAPESDGRVSVWDLEDLVQLGKVAHGCPYYASRSMQANSDVIFCPYNYVMDPVIRESTDIQIKDSVVIIDEAHNIEDVCRESSSCDIFEAMLEAARIEITDIVVALKERNKASCRTSAKLLLSFLLQIRRWMVTHANDDMEADLDVARAVWHGLGIKFQLEQMGLTKGIGERIRVAIEDISSLNDGKQQGIDSMPMLTGGVRNTLMSFVHSLQNLYELDEWESFKLVLSKRKDDRGTAEHTVANFDALLAADAFDIAQIGEGYQARRFLPHIVANCALSISFWCLNPGIAFCQVASQARSVILTSGTLSPLSSYPGELQAAFPNSCEARHVAKSDQVWVGAISHGPNGQLLEGTYKNAIQYGYQDSLGDILLEIASTVSDGLLVFLPSYQQLTRLVDRWRCTGLFRKLEATKPVFFEERLGSKDFEKTLRKYRESVSEGRGGLLFGIFRGKLSEGIDFADGMARGVVAVGIPYPNFKDAKVNYKKQFNDMPSRSKEHGCLNGHQWYEIQAYRALNQAVGRCIRHRNDWGCILFVESRMQQSSKIQSLSKWLRPYVTSFSTFSDASISLRQFCSKRQELDLKI